MQKDKMWLIQFSHGMTSTRSFLSSPSILQEYKRKSEISNYFKSYQEYLESDYHPEQSDLTENHTWHNYIFSFGFSDQFTEAKMLKYSHCLIVKAAEVLQATFDNSIEKHDMWYDQAI